MQFIIEYGHGREERELNYIAEDYSFDMEPFVSKYEFELMLNTLSLGVVGGKIVQVDGFCGLTKSMESDISTPKYQSGTLRIKDDLEQGLVYSIYNEVLPTRLNSQTGWVCIGDAQELGNAVEFVRNCVAVISRTGEFVALWLKPKVFPKLE